MKPPDLDALKAGDKDAWYDAHAWLSPTVLHAAKHVLQQHLPNEIEDVASESLVQLVEKVLDVTSVDDLKPLAYRIARNRAVGLLRKWFAKKRGEGKTTPLDEENEPTSDDSPRKHLEQKEEAELVRKSLAELKPPMREILSDFFLEGLSYEEIAKKRGIPVGSVGVYLMRGLEVLRRNFGSGGK